MPGGEAKVISLSEGLEPRELAEGEGHVHQEEGAEHPEGVDPHTFMTATNAMVFVHNIEQALSALDPANLQDTIAEYGVKAVFVGTTTNPTMSQRVAEDMGIQLVPLYSESLGEAGSGAETYLDYMRYNTQAIVEALK